ncbi:purine-binding chemotaxis protein CheW [bacterium]|nr:purine-binding chemotaxis protein CheW [bacterium]
MQDRFEILLFYLADWRFALRLPSIDKIIMAAEITPLPDAPGIVMGVLNVQGEIVSVIDIRKRFNLPSIEADLDNFFIIGKTPKRKVALLVDRVGEIIPVDRSKIIESTTILPSMEFIEGVVKLEGDIVYIHDLEQCLSLEEARKLDAALEKMKHSRKKGAAKK